MSTSHVTLELTREFPLLMAMTADPNGRAEAVPAESAEVRALVAAARAGDREAFGSLVMLHERVVFRTALAALGTREDAEDAAQEAFVMAWRRIGGFRGDSSFKTWLLTITWRKALDRRRSRRVWFSRQVTGWDEGEPLDDVAALEPSPEHATLAKDLMDRARGEIARLTPKLRDALLLAASGEHKYEEIGEMLGIPIGTVKWRVAEARRLLTLRMES